MFFFALKSSSIRHNIADRFFRESAGPAGVPDDYLGAQCVTVRIFYSLEIEKRFMTNAWPTIPYVVFFIFDAPFHKQPSSSLLLCGVAGICHLSRFVSSRAFHSILPPRADAVSLCLVRATSLSIHKIAC